MEPSLDPFSQYILDQRQWGDKTFGPGLRDAGLIDHIRKELKEIEVDLVSGHEYGVIKEWIDVFILTCDALSRHGFDGEDIMDWVNLKFEENQDRKWPDWRTVPEGKAIEHIRE